MLKLLLPKSLPSRRNHSRRLVALLVLLLAAPVARAQTTTGPMSGTYRVDIVNGTLPSEFQGLRMAVNALISRGVGGPVVLSLVHDATGANADAYGFGENTPIIIPAITGAGPANTITIKPAPGINPVISTSTSTDDAVFNLRGADYFVFDGSNVAGGTSTNLTINSTSTAMNAAVIRLTSASATDGATNNVLRNLFILSANNDATRNLGGIIVTGDSNNDNLFSNNTIQKTSVGLSITGTAANPSTGNVIDGNFIGTSRTSAITSFVTAVGIRATNAPGVQITRNVLFNIDQTSSFNVRAIELSGLSTGALMSSNRIRSVNNDIVPVTGIGFGASAILLDTGPSTGVRVINNAMSDITAVGGFGIEARAAGITVLSGTGIAIYNNSVQVDGTQLSVQPAAALIVADGVTALDVRNNIFSNIRTTGTPPVSGFDYAVFVEDGPNPNNPFATIDYNMYDVRTAAPQFIGHLNGVDASTLAAWRTATGQDRSSLSTAGYQPVGVNNSLGIMYTNNQFLLPTVTEPNNHSLNSTGVQLPGVTEDLLGNPRPTTTAAGAPDLGAYEFTPTAARPALEAEPVTANAQTFFFFGRPLVDLTYPATNPATGLTITYFPGIIPPSPLPMTALYQRAYFTIAATAPGDGYLTQTLHYEPALLGTIVLPSEQRISQQTAGGYRTDTNTQVDLAARTLTVSTGPGAVLSPFGLFTIVDNLAPLPVELIRFTATRQGPAASLSWATASEQNNRGFEVQVSTDGREFRTLTFVAGAGNRGTPRHYRYLDDQTNQAGLRYYRLRQLDTDGATSFSPVRTLHFADAQLLSGHFEVAPNPWRGTGPPTLFVTAGQPRPGCQLTVTDATGRQVLARTLDLSSGSTAQPLPGLEQLPPAYTPCAWLSGGASAIKN